MFYLKNYILLIAYIILGDVREALEQVKKYVLSESTFFNVFLEEGLRFNSFLYLCLIWIWVLKHVLENPNEAAENLKNHPFTKFVSRPSTDSYIDGLCSSLESICIGSPVKQPIEKRRLSEILQEENSSDEGNASKRSRMAWGTSSEDSALDTAPVYITKSSPKEKDKKTQENQKTVGL